MKGLWFKRSLWLNKSIHQKPAFTQSIVPFLTFGSVCMQKSPLWGDLEGLLILKVRKSLHVKR
jgi:hypothetical protein